MKRTIAPAGFHNRSTDLNRTEMFLSPYTGLGTELKPPVPKTFWSFTAAPYFFGRPRLRLRGTAAGRKPVVVRRTLVTSTPERPLVLRITFPLA